MVQGEFFGSGDAEVPGPGYGPAVRTGEKEAGKGGQPDRPLHGKLELALLEQAGDGAAYPQLAPEPAHHQVRADLGYLLRLEFPAPVFLGDLDIVGEAGQRAHDPLHTASLFELVQPAQGGDDPLAGSAVFPVTLRHLKGRSVPAWSCS